MPLVVALLGILAASLLWVVPLEIGTERVWYQTGEKIPYSHLLWRQVGRKRYLDAQQPILKASYRYGVDPDLIRSVILIESRFRPDAISPRGAMGLMQLMPATARELGVQDPLDPEKNVMGGTLYLRRLLSMFHSELDLALAAYNAGPGTVQRYGGIPPYSETQNYVQQILDVYSALQEKSVQELLLGYAAQASPEHAGTRQPRNDEA